MVWAPPLRYLTFSNHANIIQPSFIRLPSIPSAGQAARVLRCKQAIGPAGFFNAIWRHFHVSMWYDMAIHGIVWMMHLNRASIRYHQISIDFCETKKFEKGKKKGTMQTMANSMQTHTRPHLCWRNRRVVLIRKIQGLWKTSDLLARSILGPPTP